MTPRRISFLLLLFLFGGCDMLEITSDDGIQYEYETDRIRFMPTDSIKATFVNRSGQRIYIFQGCPIVQLEQHVDGTWHDIPIPIFCTMESKPPLLVSPGGQFPTRLAPWMLDDAEVEPGTYRLVLSIGQSSERASQRATSNRFEIDDSQP